MSHAPNAPGKVKIETAQTLTRQVTGAGRGSKVVAGGQAHPRDVDAVLPLILVLQVSHHLQPASRSNTPQARTARLPELLQHRRRQRCSQPRLPSDGPGNSAQPGRCHARGCESQLCSLPAPSSGRPCYGRRTGSHCSPSPRCTGTHAETKIPVTPQPAPPVGGSRGTHHPNPRRLFLSRDQGEVPVPIPRPTAQPCLACSAGESRAYLRGLIIGIRIQEDG